MKVRLSSSPLAAVLAIPLLAAPVRGPGQDLRPPATSAAAVELSSESAGKVIIPGPLRSFLRMAGISQEVAPEEVLPTVARNVSLLGYQQGKQTEFLVLLNRYVHLARQIQEIADPQGMIHVADCPSASRLVGVLGYRFEGTCGQKNAVLMTADPEKAFLTIDSGFPLTTLEEDLGKSQPFDYSFPATRVPTFFREKDWRSLTSRKGSKGGNVLDLLMADQDFDRVYWALAQCDQETRTVLLDSPGVGALIPLAPVFNLYGSGISIHNGSVVTPGGSARDWAELAGVEPSSPGEFVRHLLSRDRGWLAAYYDALARVNLSQQAHLTADGRLRRLYEAYRSTLPRTGAAYGVFPRNAELLILFLSARWDEKGSFEVREGDSAWGKIFAARTRSNNHLWPSQGHRYDTSEHLLETLAASTNSDTEDGPLQTFQILEAINSGKPGAGNPGGTRLSDDTEVLIASRLAQFNHWFSIFAEFPTLDDAAVNRFVNAADRIDGISNPALRANALGAIQANIGLWQIFARQGQIGPDRQAASWLKVVEPFTGVSTPVDVFEAARSSLQSIFTAAGGSGSFTQDQLVELLAGPGEQSPDARRVHQQLAGRIRSVLEDQRLVSLDTLFGLYDGMKDLEHGGGDGERLLPLAGNLREFEMPRPIFTGSERTQWAPTVYSSRHAELQIRTDLTKILETKANPAQLETARGQLTPFLRDTLVGLNYAYFEPPGAEVLHHNPLFVRSHDFSLISILDVSEFWGAPDLIGVGATAGGGAYLMGSLVDLPYALASTEQDFIAPRNVQALIWKEIVPELLVDSVLPRWWSVSQNELHAAALYQKAGEELLLTASSNPELRRKVVAILASRITPDRLEKASHALESRDATEALLPEMLPIDNFYLAAEFRRQYPDQAPQCGPAARELSDLAQRDPSDVSPAHLSSDFGTPHPALSFTNSRTLLITRPLPAFAGSANRLLAESWESNNLYWARLADEKGYSPVMLNVLAPALTRRMVANLFASNIDDWPALLRAMHETGDEFRQGRITVGAANSGGR